MAGLPSSLARCLKGDENSEDRLRGDCMRHGWEWWEAFWKWLKDEAVDAGWTHEGETIKDWMKSKKAEFEELWRRDPMIP